MLLTIVICTYDRSSLLEGTLASLAKQTTLPEDYRLIVVDNAGQAEVRRISEYYGAVYIHEPRTGLSHARNSGWRAAETPWVLYLDDDIQVPPNLIERYISRLSTADCGALGGWYRHWFLTPPPAWLLAYYGEGRKPCQDIATFSELTTGQTLSGNNMAVRRSALANVGGYSPELGMSGNRIAYGEDDLIQYRLRAAGYRIFYDPDIVIEHLVQSYKYRILSRIQMQYARGRDGAWMLTPVRRSKVYAIYRAVRCTFMGLPVAGGKVLMRPDYYWQNLIVDVIGEYAYALGLLLSPSTEFVSSENRRLPRVL